MTTVQHFKPNLRDVFFNLFEVLEIQSTVLGKAPFESMDEHTARAALEGMLEVMQAKWTPTFASGDREGTHFDGKGNVTIDYRPVHTYTLTNDVAYVEPKERVY